jgi:creatinine amidohydrolase
MNYGQVPEKYNFARLSTEQLSELIKGERPVLILIPVGAVEPHGPHLSLLTDVFISTEVAVRAARQLKRKGMYAFIAPPISYSIANCGGSFAGCVTVSPETFRAYVGDVVKSFLKHGVAHVSLVNSHLEPEHDQALRAVAEESPEGRVTVASPLTHRWAKTLSAEFKRGACHAGRYETSIMLAAAPEFVEVNLAGGLPEVDVSLSEKLKEGVTDFQEMGLSRSYAGAPAAASAIEGEELLQKLTEMVITEVMESRE